MLVIKKLNSRSAQAGVTLVELMISIALGLLLLGAATAMTVSSMVMNGDTLKSSRLNQDLDSVLQVMVNDIRRAGYSANFIQGQPGVVFAAEEDLKIVSASCILYAYNANGDSALGSEEKFGFRWRGDGYPIEMGAAVTSCGENATGWVPLTDTGVITITDLSFDSVNSKCFNFSDPGNGNTAYWVISKEDNIKFPCMAGEETESIIYVTDDSGDYPEDDEGERVKRTFVASTDDPSSGDTVIESRQVTVRIMGNLSGNDSSMRKEQSVAINVRNNTITVIP